MIKRRVVIWLVLITLVGAGLRLWQIESLPALNADEAAIGYNAYSLIETGKDEFGNPWPVHFASFGDFKPGGYFYLALPFVWGLGLHGLAVRLPGLILGIGSIPMMYFLVRELFRGRRREWAVVAALLLAISPWHILFSRGAWEVNVASFFLMVGTWAFLVGGRKPRFYVLFVMFCLAALYTYHAARIVVPLLVLGMVVFYRGRFWPFKRGKGQVKWLGLAVGCGLLLGLPLVRDVLGGGVLAARASGVGLLADVGPMWRANDLRGQHGERVPVGVVRMLHNRGVTYGLEFLANWMSHFDGDFLFINGDEIQRSKVPETGQLYLIELAFLVVGILVALNLAKKGEKGAKLIVWWFLIGPVAAAMTFQSPHALRSENMVIPALILVTVGMEKVVEWVRLRFGGVGIRGVMGVLILAYGFCFVKFVHGYFVHLAPEYPFASQWGFKELADYVKEKEGDFEEIYITDRYDQPYILLLFYLKYPPERFQEDHVVTSRDKFGFWTVRAFDKYRFRSISWDEMRDWRGVLLIGTDEEVPALEANVMKRIYFPNGEVEFEAVPL